MTLPEGGAHKHREWQPMPDLRRGREDEGDDDDEVGEGHGGDALEREHVEVHRPRGCPRGSKSACRR
jgi:hypothetical protein